MPITPRCPTCRKPVTWEGNPHRPFCSERCRTVDLGSWAAERYRIAGEGVSVEDLPGSETAAKALDQGKDTPPGSSRTQGKREAARSKA